LSPFFREGTVRLIKPQIPKLLEATSESAASGAAESQEMAGFNPEEVLRKLSKHRLRPKGQIPKIGIWVKHRRAATTPALIHTGRPDGYLDYFNQRWLEFLGLPLEEVCGWR
jgi:hypothetical protein